MKLISIKNSKKAKGKSCNIGWFCIWSGGTRLELTSHSKQYSPTTLFISSFSCLNWRVDKLTQLWALYKYSFPQLSPRRWLRLQTLKKLSWKERVPSKILKIYATHLASDNARWSVGSWSNEVPRPNIISYNFGYLRFCLEPMYSLYSFFSSIKWRAKFGKANFEILLNWMKRYLPQSKGLKYRKKWMNEWMN